jgi:predicted small lipoprotein YifL
MNSDIPTRRRPVVALLAALGVCVALAGCGQKGVLYLPNQKKKVPAPQPQPESQPSPAPSGAQ